MKILSNLSNIKAILDNEINHVLGTHRVIARETNWSQIVYFMGPAVLLAQNVTDLKIGV